MRMRRLISGLWLPGLLIAASAGIVGCPADTDEPEEVLDGSTLWARRAGGLRDDRGEAVAAFAEGGGIAAGQFGGTGVFGEGEPGEETLFAQGLRDIYVARYAADGGLEWAKRAGGTGEEFATAVAAMPDGSFYLTGYFEETAVFGEGDPMRTVLTSVGGFDGVVARYNANGTLAWARRFGGEGADQAMAVAPLSDGGCLVAGAFTGTITVQGATSNTVIPEPYGGLDILVIRYDSLGRPIWSRRAGGAGDDVAHAIATMSDDSYYLAGVFTDVAGFGGSGSSLSILNAYGYDEEDEATHDNMDAFVARYTREGALRWVRGAGGPGTDAAYDLGVTAEGRCLIAGSFENTAYFGLGYALSQDVRSEGGSDLFAAQYNDLGDFRWVASGGGPQDDIGSSVVAFEDGSCAVGGAFSGRGTFYSTRRSDPVTWDSAGESDAILLYVNAQGYVAWSHRVGGLRADGCTALARVAGDRFLATGYFSSQATFPVIPPGDEEPTETEDGVPLPTETIRLTARGETDAFVAGFLPPPTEGEEAEN